MIENMRKYTGLMAVVFVLLGAGFLFTMNSFNNTRGGGGGQSVLSVGSRSVDQGEWRRMGSSTLQLCDMIGLASYSNLLLAPDHRQLQQVLRFGGISYHRLHGNSLTQADLNRFIAARIILQNAMEEYGLYASDGEVFEAIQELPAFTGPDGKFSKASYDQLLEKHIGKLGLTQADLIDVVREHLCLMKLVQIVGGGMLPPRSAARDSVEAQNQSITLAKVEFKLDDFIKKQNPTEADVQAHWKSTRDQYKTEERRRISYVLLTLPEEKEEAPKPAPANETPEAKKAREEAEAKARDAKEKKNKEAGKVLTKQITALYTDVVRSLEKKQKLDFAKLAEDQKLKLVKTDFFSQANAPAELKNLTLRSLSQRGQSLAQHIFAKANSKDPYDRLSEALPVGKHGWIIYQLDEIDEPDLLEFDAAKKKAREDLINIKAKEALKKSAKDGRQAVLDLMASGKDFDTAAREKGFTPIQVGPYSLYGTPPKDEPSFRNFFYTAAGLNPGDVCEVMDEPERSVFFWVERRELEDKEDNQIRINGEIEAGKSDLRLRAYMNWLDQRLQDNPLSGSATKAPK